MKKLLLPVLVLMLALALLVACAPHADDTPDDGGTTQTPGGSETPDNPNNPDNPDNPDNPNNPDNPDNPEVKHTYLDFTATEWETVITFLGERIPFLPNDEYYLDVGSDEYGTYLNFYTFGNTEAEYNAYLALYIDYTFAYSYDDTFGDTWSVYEKGDISFDICFYLDTYEGVETTVVDIYFYVETGGTDTPAEPSDGFTSAEEQLIVGVIGETVPFIPSDEYHVEKDSDEYGEYISYYTFGNTRADFDAFVAALDGYTLASTEKDDYGDTWYTYVKGNIVVDCSIYYYENEWVIDIYLYLDTESGTGDGGNTGEGGNTGDGENTGGGNTDGPATITDVDFTKAENVKDVTDQGYYLDGCPTVGSPTVLVVPVEFLDVTAESRGYDLSKIAAAFSSIDPNDGFYSVYEYYLESSYERLSIDFTVLDEWFMPSKASTYYADSTDSEGYMNGDQLVIDELLAYLEDKMDLSVFDSDGNTVIDAIVIIHTLDIDENSDFYWAYRYWNYHTDADGYYYEYDGVSANDYLWASFDFMHEGYDESGDVNYDNENPINTYTFIHEFGHVLGADDYYDTEYVNEPMGGCDIMDSLLGDHNPYTKFNYGWLTTSKLVTGEGSVTVTLDAFVNSGDTVIIANSFDHTLGAYQEYYVIAYYTNTGLNGGDGGYFARDGIVVYHVNSTLYSEEYDGKLYYDIAYNNTDPSGEYGTENNLIEYVKSTEGNFTYVAGDTMGSVITDTGAALSYTFTVDSIDGETATITITSN